MDEEDLLEARIAELRALLATPPELEAATLAWREAFVVFRNARGEPDEERLKQRYLGLLDEYNKLARPHVVQAMQQGYPLVQLQRELSVAQVALAAIRSEPYLVAIRVDRAALVGTGGSEMFELWPDPSVCNVMLLQTDFGPPAVAFDAPSVAQISIWEGWSGSW